MNAGLWVDDCKPCPNGYAVARTYDDALSMLRRFEYETLFLDHDLADNHHPERTGYDLLLKVLQEGRAPDRVRIISLNPIGRGRIAHALDDAGYDVGPDGGWFRSGRTVLSERASSVEGKA